MISDERLAEIEARCKAATPGPWGVKTAAAGSHDVGIIAEIHGKRHVLAEVWAEVDGFGSDAGRCRLDGEFIAAARSDVTALVAEVRRLREMRCETCEHWTRTDTESYAEYGKCAFWHGIARPRRSGAGPIRTRDSFFCKSYKPKGGSDE